MSKKQWKISSGSASFSIDKMDETAFSQKISAQPGNSHLGLYAGTHLISLDYEEKFAFHSAHLIFKSNSKEMADEIGALYDYFRIDSDCPEGFCLKAIDRGSNGPGRKRFMLLEGDQLTWAARTFKEFFPLVEWAIFNAAIARIDSFYQLHAAAVSTRQKGVLLVGGPGSGKTVTALALLLGGYKYISDEVTLIEIESLFMHPLPRPFLIKSSGFGHFRGLRQKLGLKTFRLASSGEELWYVNPKAITIDAIGRPCKADFVILLDGGKLGQAKLEKLSKSKAAAEIIEGSFNFPSDFRRGVDAVARITAGASCFRLASADPKRSVELIEGLLSRQK